MRQYLQTYLPYLLPALSLLVVQPLAAGFSTTTQLVILAIAMATTGIPHGALDYLIFQQQERSAGRSHSLFRFLCYYLGLMLFYGALWWINPSLSLLLFLLISAWHFADNDLASLPLNQLPDNLFRIVFGGWLLLVLVFGHTDEVIPYLQQIIGNNSFLIDFTLWYQPYAVTVFGIGVVAWPLVLWLRMRNEDASAEQWYPIITLLLLLVLCRQLPLILGFAIYFAIWHSLRSFRSIWIYLHTHNKWMRSTRQLVMPALPFVLGAFGSLVAFFIWSNATQTSLTPLWIFLSLITLPHCLLMHDVFGQPANAKKA